MTRLEWGRPKGVGRPSAVVSLIIVAALSIAAPAAAAPAGSTLLVSRPDGLGPAPVPLDDSSRAVALSDDGRYAAFTSRAPFAGGANQRLFNLFVRDTLTGATTLASRSDGSGGAPANADVDAFGRAAVAVEPGGVALDPPHDRPHVLVAFDTTATNLSDHRTGPTATGGVEEVWLRDVTASTSYLVSRTDGVAGAQADGHSADPSIAITDHGPVVAFTSSATNLGATANVFVRSVNDAQTLRVSCHQQNCASGGPSSAALPSARFVSEPVPSLCAIGFTCVLVAFDTDDGTITGDPTNGRSHVVVASATETATGLHQFDSWVTASKADGSGTTFGNDTSFNPSLSPDGRAVAFISSATNLVSGPQGSGFNKAYLRALDGTGATTLVSRSSAGEPADGPAYDVSVGGDSADRRVTFTVSASNFGVPNPFGLASAWERDLSTGSTELLDRAAGASEAFGDGQSSQAGISADGTRVLFTSESHNLDAGGGLDFARAYVRHLDNEALQLVSRPDGTGPFPTGVRDSTIDASAVSADGRYVAFRSNSDHLASGEDNRFRGVFVRDLLTGTTTLASRATGPSGAAANADAIVDGISDDGHRVLFTTTADNLVGGPAVERAYVRDLVANTTTVASRANGPSGAIAIATEAAISGDGDSVVFINGGPLDPDEFPGVEHVYVRDLAAQTTTLVDRDNGAAGRSAQSDAEAAVIDRDGGRVAWTTRDVLAGTPLAPTVTRVYERDLRAGTTMLVSRAEGAAGAVPNADSTSPAIDAKGDVVAFQSAATNLGALVTGQAVWVRDVSGGHLQLASRATGAAGAVADQLALNPSLDGAGDRVAFRSPAGNLGAGPQATTGDWQAYVRDLPSQTTEVASRADGSAGAPIDTPGPGSVSISANGDCVAFDAAGLNSGDGFASPWFAAVHLRVLRRECPVDPPDTAITSGPSGITPNPTPTFTFTFSVGPATFECSLDGQAFGACASPLTTSRLRDGAYEFAVRAVDQAGYADPTPATRTFSVDTRPAPARPVLSALKLVPNRFAVIPRHAPKHRTRIALGTSIRFRLSLPARVSFTIVRQQPGRRSGKRCLPAHGKVPRRKRCTRPIKAGTFARNTNRGPDRIAFSGHVGRHALAPGTYLLTATPIDASLHRGASRSAQFTVVRARRRRG
jgi:Tol biopolymer transport system component